VHYRADLQSVHGFRCYDDIAPNAKRQRVLVLGHVRGSVVCRIFYLIVDPTFVTLAGIPLLLMDVVPRLNNMRICLLSAVDAALQASAVRTSRTPSSVPGSRTVRGALPM